MDSNLAGLTPTYRNDNGILYLNLWDFLTHNQILCNKVQKALTKHLCGQYISIGENRKSTVAL